jgi:hypothetical protein
MQHIHHAAPAMNMRAFSRCRAMRSQKGAQPEGQRRENHDEREHHRRLEVPGASHEVGEVEDEHRA